MRKRRSPPGQGKVNGCAREGSRTPTTDQAPCWTPGPQVTALRQAGVSRGPPQQGLSPVLGDRGVGLGRAVERDHVVLQHWLRLHRQVDERGVCGEKRRLCRLRCCVHHGLGEHEGKGQQFTPRVSQSSHSPGGPQKTGGLSRGFPLSLEVPESGCPGSGLRTPAMDSRYCCSVTKLYPSNSLRPHGLRHARLPCPPLSPGVCSNSCPLSW